MKDRRFSNEEFKEALLSTTSLGSAMKKVGLMLTGGNYRIARKIIRELGLEPSDFINRNCNKGRKFGPKRPIEFYLQKNKALSTNSLKKRLIREGLFKHQCCDCKLETWKNEPIPLELHHIDGDPENNTLENLQVLCPNCHALTDNYCGKNIKHKLDSPKAITKCLSCDKEHKNKKYCSFQCSIKPGMRVCLPRPSARKAIRPNETDLIKMINDLGYVGVGKLFSVSDGAIRKWEKQYLKDKERKDSSAII